MSWLVDLRRYARQHPGRIGPGRLVLVVGPSGAGKDTLIDGARRACADDGSIVFARRVITRPPSPAEVNISMSEDAFDQSATTGGFAMWWQAHGHRYGIPSEIDHDIRAGRTVVCNVSRTILDTAQRRYATVTVVLVTAPEAVLKARLAHRARASDGEMGQRMARPATLNRQIAPDVTIPNVGRPETGVRRLLNTLRDPGLFLVY